MNKGSFLIYTQYAEQLEMLSDEQAGVLFKAIMRSQSCEELPKMDALTTMLFSIIKGQIDRDQEKYEEACQKRAEAGKKGGRPRKTEVSKEKQEVLEEPEKEEGKRVKAKKANGFSEKAKKANGFLAFEKNPDNDNENENDNDIYKNILCASDDALCECAEQKKPALKQKDANVLFEKLWALYPQKRGKGQVSDAKKKKLLEVGFEDMQKAIERYKSDLEKDDWRKPQNGSTFFNSGYLDYIGDNYVPTQRGRPKNSFNNFEGRSYDMAELEKKLLEK